MTFFESIKTVFRKYATFEGRATRPEFWWFALFSFLVSSALSALLPPQYMPGYYDGMMLGDGYPSMMGDGAFGVGAFGAAQAINLAGFWSVAVLLPSLAVTVRRLRDAGHRWTQIFWILLPIVGAIILIVRLADPTRVEGVAVAPAAETAPPAA